MPTTPADGNAGDQSACMRFGCADNPIAISYVISHKLIMKLVLNTAAMVAAVPQRCGGLTAVASHGPPRALLRLKRLLTKPSIVESRRK